MRVIIMGCGRVGARLATILDDQGHDVTVIDFKSDAFRRLSPSFGGRVVLGNGIDEEVLRKAGIERMDAFAAVTNGDNRNVMAAQIAKHIFNVKHVVCRIYDPIRAETYTQLGLKAVCPTNIGADFILAALLDQPAPAIKEAR